MVVVVVGVGVGVVVVVGVEVGVVVGVVVVVVVYIKENHMQSKKGDGIKSLIGKPVFIRAVTHYYTGRLVAITPDAFVLADAAWIADTGHWGTALKAGSLREVEPYPGRCYVMRGAIVDMCEWTHALPREQK